MYIVHRKISQPESGRRLLASRRMLNVFHDPERRHEGERRILPDRRKANH